MIEIPVEIIALCLTWYHLKYDDIEFDIYHKDVIEMITDDNTEWRGIGGSLRNRMLSTSIGYNEGIHEWIIHCVKDCKSYQATGIISNKWHDRGSRWFNNGHNGYCYYLYGHNEYKIKRIEQGSSTRYTEQELSSDIHWKDGDNIIVTLDCEQWTISFKLNDKPIGLPVNIQPNLTYYPTIATCGANDHYRVNE